MSCVALIYVVFTAAQHKGGTGKCLEFWVTADYYPPTDTAFVLIAGEMEPQRLVYVFELHVVRMCFRFM